MPEQLRWAFQQSDWRAHQVAPAVCLPSVSTFPIDQPGDDTIGSRDGRSPVDLEIKATMGAGAPVRVIADGRKVRQAIVNDIARKVPERRCYKLRQRGVPQWRANRDATDLSHDRAGLCILCWTPVPPRCRRGRGVGPWHGASAPQSRRDRRGRARHARQPVDDEPGHRWRLLELRDTKSRRRVAVGSEVSPAT